MWCQRLARLLRGCYGSPGHHWPRLPRAPRPILAPPARCHPTAPASPPCAWQLHQDHLELRYGSTVMRLDFVWLRDHCRSASCYNAKTNQRSLDTASVDLDIQPQAVRVDDTTLFLTWPDGHVTRYGLEWLARNSYEGQQQQVMHPRILWNADIYQQAQVPSIDCQHFLQTHEGLKEFLQNFLLYGIAFVENVPPTKEDTEILAKRISIIRETIYGRMWYFTSDFSRGDTAYTKLALDRHTDTTYFQEPCGIQVFHCLKHEGTGGRTLLVDGFHAAEQVRLQAPELFELLAKVPLKHEYVENVGDCHNHMIGVGPVLNVYPWNNELYLIRYNNYDRAVINTVPHSVVRRWYRAHRALTAELRRPHNELWVKLKPGKMPLCRPPELLGNTWVLLAGLLVLFPRALAAPGPVLKAAAVGSSVLLPGLENITHSDSLCWEFLNGSGPRPILQHQGGILPPALHAPYAGRAVFHPSNGSLLLEDVQESDSGTYRVTGGRESLEFQLEVLQPVSRPQLWASSLVARATGRVVCEVAEGRVGSITWRKDGQPLSPDRVSGLSSSRSVLYLRPAKRSDCGSYSCNASNGISWQETSLEVTIEGLSRRLKHTLRISVVAVVFAVISAWGLIIPVCQSQKLRIRGELWRWLSCYTCGLVCLACILDGTAGVLWMWEEGPSVAVILPEITLSYLTVVTFLVATTVIFQPADFSHLKSRKAQLTMGYAAPGAVVAVVLSSSFLIKGIHQRHEGGCTEFMDVTILVASTAAVAALPLLAIGLCYQRTQGWHKDNDGSWTDKVSSFEMSQPGTKDTIPS